MRKIKCSKCNEYQYEPMLSNSYPEDKYVCYNCFKSALEKRKYGDVMSDDKKRYDRHSELLDKISKTYIEKNTAYGNSFDRSIDRFGYVSAIVRMEDKLNRLEQLLLNNANPNDESAIDTCLDLANYSIMLAMKVESKQ